ncbi:MAG: hypothetical protein LBP79_04565 [Clostridiales bacterium]|jgi:MraZ protein|nr:hypothetical protein [Clostridiales bacterium]
MSFFGNYRLVLDDKGRMRIPAKYREELGAGFALTFGPKESVYILSAAKAKEHQDDLIAIAECLDLTQADEQDALRAVAESLYFPEVDEQGRFVLREEYKNFAKIKKEIVVSGAVDKLTLSGAESYDAQFAKRDYDSVMKKLRELKLKIAADKAGGHKTGTPPNEAGAENTASTEKSITKTDGATDKENAVNNAGE